MSSLPPYKNINTPLGGWAPNTWYLIEVSFSSNNPVHKSLLYSGFLNGKDNRPGGYHCIIPCNGAGEVGYIDNAYYLNVIKVVLREQDYKN